MKITAVEAHSWKRICVWQTYLDTETRVVSGRRLHVLSWCSPLDLAGPGIRSLPTRPCHRSPLWAGLPTGSARLRCKRGSKTNEEGSTTRENKSKNKNRRGKRRDGARNGNTKVKQEREDLNRDNLRVTNVTFYWPSQLAKKFRAFYRTRSFITVFTKPLH